MSVETITITIRSGVRFISSPAPATDVAAILKGYSEVLPEDHDDVVMDSLLASHFQSSMAFGLKKDTQALRKELGIHNGQC